VEHVSRGKTSKILGSQKTEGKKMHLLTKLAKPGTLLKRGERRRGAHEKTLHQIGSRHPLVQWKPTAKKRKKICLMVSEGGAFRPGICNGYAECTPKKKRIIQLDAQKKDKKGFLQRRLGKEGIDRKPMATFGKRKKVW